MIFNEEIASLAVCVSSRHEKRKSEQQSEKECPFRHGSQTSVREWKKGESAFRAQSGKIHYTTLTVGWLTPPFQMSAWQGRGTAKCLGCFSTRTYELWNFCSSWSLQMLEVISGYTVIRDALLQFEVPAGAQENNVQLPIWMGLLCGNKCHWVWYKTTVISHVIHDLKALALCVGIIYCHYSHLKRHLCVLCFIYNDNAIQHCSMFRTCIFLIFSLYYYCVYLLYFSL